MLGMPKLRLPQACLLNAACRTRVLCRLGEEEFVCTARGCDLLAWPPTHPGTLGAEVTDISPETFIFAIQGPASLLMTSTASAIHHRTWTTNPRLPSSRARIRTSRMTPMR